ncbi:MAG: hypothetical protein HY696_06680 [Deltaproteobacteria bacterium]|nr:hypothetical protein [Deltaproteobacteria bacterium]
MAKSISNRPGVGGQLPSRVRQQPIIRRSAYPVVPAALHARAVGPGRSLVPAAHGEPRRGWRSLFGPVGRLVARLWGGGKPPPIDPVQLLMRSITMMDQRDPDRPFVQLALADDTMAALASARPAFSLTFQRAEGVRVPFQVTTSGTDGFVVALHGQNALFSRTGTVALDYRDGAWTLVNSGDGELTLEGNAMENASVTTLASKASHPLSPLGGTVTVRMGGYTLLRFTYPRAEADDQFEPRTFSIGIDGVESARQARLAARAAPHELSPDPAHGIVAGLLTAAGDDPPAARRHEISLAEPAELADDFGVAIADLPTIPDRILALRRETFRLEAEAALHRLHYSRYGFSRQMTSIHRLLPLLTHWARRDQDFSLLELVLTQQRDHARYGTVDEDFFPDWLARLLQASRDRATQRWDEAGIKIAASGMTYADFRWTDAIPPRLAPYTAAEQARILAHVAQREWRDQENTRAGALTAMLLYASGERSRASAIAIRTLAHVRRE